MEENVNIYFDESGNTGESLGDLDQPLFSLASINMDDETAEALISNYKHSSEPELKFSKLKRSQNGRIRICGLLKELLPFSENIFVSLVHKQFMTVSKIVDVLLESLYWDMGIDFYKDGRAKATALMYFYCMPTFCGQVLFDSLLNKFVGMIRNTSEESINDFYRVLGDMVTASVDIEFRDSIHELRQSDAIVREILQRKEIALLEPMIPAYVAHCHYWGDTLGTYFHAISDDSKPLQAAMEDLKFISAETNEFREVYFGGKKYSYPLKMASLEFADSKSICQLQIVDVLAGSLNHAYKTAILQGKDDSFSKQIHEIVDRHFLKFAIWPPKWNSIPEIRDELNESNQTPFPVDAVTERLFRTGSG